MRKLVQAIDVRDLSRAGSISVWMIATPIGLWYVTGRDDLTAPKTMKAAIEDGGEKTIVMDH